MKKKKLSAPLWLANHQRRHLLRRPSAVADADATTPARIPAENEQLGLQKKPVFSQLAEHIGLQASLTIR
jgi:hypothetical protein